VPGRTHHEVDGLTHPRGPRATYLGSMGGGCAGIEDGQLQGPVLTMRSAVTAPLGRPVWCPMPGDRSGVGAAPVAAWVTTTSGRRR
jgi:hypothetical protein